MVRDKEAHQRLAECVALMKSGQVDASIEGLCAVLARYPQDLMALQFLGAAYAMKGDLDRAQVQLETALALDPTSAQLNYNLAVNYQKQGRNEDAIHLATEALRLKPDYAAASLAISHWQTLQTIEQPVSTDAPVTPVESIAGSVAVDLDEFCAWVHEGRHGTFPTPVAEYGARLQKLCALYMEKFDEILPIPLLQTLKLLCVQCGREYRDSETASFLESDLPGAATTSYCCSRCGCDQGEIRC